MSLLTRTSSLLSVTPKQEHLGPRLIATSSPWVQAVSLFSFCRQVVVDARTSEVVIRRCRYWLKFDEERIPFDRIVQIDYDFEGSAGKGQVDAFTVGLILDDPREKKHLFAFHRRGKEASNKDGKRRSQGRDLGQQDPSLQFVEALLEFFDAPLSRPFEIFWGKACPSCSRRNPRQSSECMYCGEDFEAPSD